MKPRHRDGPSTMSDGNSQYHSRIAKAHAHLYTVPMENSRAITTSTGEQTEDDERNKVHEANSFHTSNLTFILQHTSSLCSLLLLLAVVPSLMSKSKQVTNTQHMLIFLKNKTLTSVQHHVNERYLYMHPEHCPAAHFS